MRCTVLRNEGTLASATFIAMFDGPDAYSQALKTYLSW